MGHLLNHLFTDLNPNLHILEAEVSKFITQLL